MKGKLPSIVTAIIAFAMVFSLVAAFTPATVVADSPTDVITAVTMPTQGRGNLAVDTAVVALAQAVDGTMFAGVYDQGDTRWTQTVVTTSESRDFAVFISKNGGYDWTQGFIVPWDDNSRIVEIVPVPDYSSNNSIVYMATETYVYVSVNGGKTFTRTDAQVPYVGVGDNYITSLDVAANINGGGYVCVVGTDGDNAGVFTYNEGGYADWRDKQIGNDTAADSAVDAVYDVKFSTRYTADKDKVILAVAYVDDSTNLNDKHTILTVRGTLGTWGVEALDAVICAGTIDTARIVLPSDYHWISNPRSFVAITGGSDPDAYRITSIQSPGAPSVKRMNVAGADDIDVYDIAISGTGASTVALVAIPDSDNGLQVYRSTNAGGFSPTWQPSHKPPVGGQNIGSGYDFSPATLVWTSADAFIASASNGYTVSGVSKLVEGALGMAWNGVGLIDTIAASGNYLDYSEDLVAGPIWVSASPNFNLDQTIFMATNGKGGSYGDPEYNMQFMWRTSNGGATWDLIAVEDLAMAEGVMDAAFSWEGYTAQQGDFWPMKPVPTFNNSKGADQTMFVMARNEAKSFAQWIFKSTDAGNTWKAIIAMPDYSTSLWDSGWCVVDDNTLIVTDYYGTVYKTTDNGYSWTTGAVTTDESDTYVASLKFYNDPTMGLIVLAGLDDMNDDTPEAWISLDGGNNFAQVGTSLGNVPGFPGDSSFTQVDFDNNWSTNHEIYVAFGGTFDDWYYYYSNPDADNGVWKLDSQYDAGIWRASVITSDPTSSLWQDIVDTNDVVAMMPKINPNMGFYEDGEDSFSRAFIPTALEVGPANTIYVTFAFFDDYRGGKFTEGGFIRCLSGTAATPQWGFIDEGMPSYGGLWQANVVTGSQILFSVGLRLDLTGASDLIDSRLLMYKDTLASQAGSMVPASGAKNVGTISGGKVNAPLSWGGISGTQYSWQVALDSNFGTIVKEGTSSTSAATVSGLEMGTTYYWRVKATAPTAGPWSATTSFTTVSTVSGAPTLISPANGAELTKNTPVFTWTGVTGATSYKIQAATDSGFTALAIDKTATTTAYESDKLENDTYYWRVQATVGSDITAWSATGAFTVGTTSATSSTPAWVWVLIVLGIVLAIFVLVLILRTRRPV